MRVLLRILAPLLGLCLAAVGVIVVIEVVAAWLQPVQGRGLVVPWAAWRTTLENLSWNEAPVPAIAIGVAVLGLLFVLLALMARRHDVVLDPPSPGITVTTSPQALARLVGRRVRAAEAVTGATVTASRRAVAVRAEGWSTDGDLNEVVRTEVAGLLDELPLAVRPRVGVTTRGRKGPR